MRSSSALSLLSVLLLSACGDPIGGFWIGGIECDRIPYQFEMTMEADKGKAYAGSGEQFREFTDPSTGNITEITIDFDASLSLISSSGPQDLITDLSCTSETTINYLAGRTEAEIVGEGCDPTRFRDWSVAWDGEDRLDVSGPDGCAGFLVRR